MPQPIPDRRNADEIPSYSMGHRPDHSGLISRSFGKLGIILLETPFVEDHKAIFFAIFHMERCNRKYDPLPLDFCDLISWQYQLFILLVHGKLLAYKSNRLLVQV